MEFKFPEGLASDVNIQIRIPIKTTLEALNKLLSIMMLRMLRMFVTCCCVRRSIMSANIFTVPLCPYADNLEQLLRSILFAVRFHPH